MKRTTTINLAGLVFHIEESGYQILGTYFKDLKRIFANQEGSEEILSDIESRFAELFTERLSAFKEVITEEDVNVTIAIMGSPHQFEEEESTDSSADDARFYSEFQARDKKRLYRDKEEGMIGGVAAGTAHYLNLDPVLIRVLWIVFVLLGGSGVLIYIIAWIAIPEAKTTSEKLNMRGESVNLDSIKKYADNLGREAKKGFNKASDSVKRGVNRSSEGMRQFGQLLIKVLGGIILFSGIISLLSIIFGLFFNYSEISLDGSAIKTDVKSLIDLFFIEQNLSFFFILIVAAIPVIFLIILGAKLLFGKNLKVKITSWTLLSIWVLGIGGLIFMGVRSGLNFKESYTSEEKFYIERDIQNLALHLFEGEDEVLNGVDYEFENYLTFDGDEVVFGYTHIEVLPTDDSLFYYVVEKNSKGGSLKNAKENVENIRFTITQKDSALQMPIRYRFSKENKFRGQKVKVKFYVPVTKEVTLNGNLKEYPIRINAADSFSKSQVKTTSTWTATDRGMQKN